MGELSNILEEVRKAYEGTGAPEVKRLSKKTKCNKCHYSALCLAASFQEVVERLKLFVCPECKGLFATFIRKTSEEGEEVEEDTIKEVPLPGCAAFVFSCGNHVCSEACRNAQENARPAFGRGIFDKYAEQIKIRTPAAPNPLRPIVSPTPGMPNGNSDIWWGSTKDSTTYTISHTSDSANAQVENNANRESQQEHLGQAVGQVATNAINVVDQAVSDAADAFAQGYADMKLALENYYKEHKEE